MGKNIDQESCATMARIGTGLRASVARARRGEPGWRAAVLDERAKRVRKAAATERQTPRAERAIRH
jgi:hypothetical protein